MSLPTVLFLVPAGVCVLAWYGAGSLVPARLVPGGSRLLDGVSRLAAGSLAWSLFLLLLGRTGAFHRPAIVTPTVALALLGAWRGRGFLLRRLRLPKGAVVRALLGLTVFALVLDLVAASTPPTSADALVYHLALPEQWLLDGNAFDPFWLWRAFNPFGVEMLYAQGLALAGGTAASALGAALATLTAAAVYGLGRELGAGSTLAGAAAAALFVLQGVVTWEATSAFVELGTTFYAAVAAWHAVRFMRARSPRSAGWAGVAAGASAGTKYFGLLVVALAVAGVALSARRRVRMPALTLGLALAAGGAWYLKNLIVAHNPVYPLAFGGRWWTPASEQGLSGLSNAYGVGGSPLRLLLLPAELLLRGGSFDRGQYVGPVVFVLALLAPLAARRTAALALLAASAVFIVAWWYLSPQARFLLPALAGLAAVGGAGAAAAWDRGPRSRAVVGALLAAAALFWLVPSAALTRTLLPAALGVESRPHFAQRLTGTYDALQDVARRTRGPVAFAGYPFTYWFPRRAIYLGAAEFASDVPRGVYLRRLQRYGVRYVLVQTPEQVPELDPIRACLYHLATLRARFVTSRTSGTSSPLALELYALGRCRSAG